MGPKYEFTDETMNYEGTLLHRIRRLSDGKLGGWIEKEKNLSQEGNCWVDGDAKVYDNAQIYSNAQVFDNAQVYGNALIYGSAIVYGEAVARGNVEVYSKAKVYGDACVSGNAKVYEDAQVYDNAQVYDKAYVSGNAKVFNDARVYDDAWVYGDAKIYDHAEVCGYAEVYDNVSINEEILSKEVIQDFIYKIDNSNKLEVETKYDSIDEFFNANIENNDDFNILVICSVDTKIPLIKLEKSNNDGQMNYKFIVDITSENEDRFMIKSIIKDKDQLNALISQTVEALRLYPQFTKYADNLEDCIN